MADNQDALISQFVSITRSTVEQATEYLTVSNWDIGMAVTNYYRQSSGEAVEPTAESEEVGRVPSEGGMMAFSRPRATFSKPPPKKKGLATLSSLGGNRDEDDDDDDDYEDEDESNKPRDLFAGGEKSGLAVQDPSQGPSAAKKLISDIISQAKSNASRPNPQDPSAPGPSSSSFRGAGQTLGGDGVESRVIPGPQSRAETLRPRPGQGPPGQQGQQGQQPDGETQERSLHLWTDGFSIDDGPLHRFDDPRNRQDLDMIRNGRAPLHLMNVRLDQPVNVSLQQHHEDWHQLPRVYRPFGGEGRRLGNPVPGESAGASAAIASTAAATTTSQQPGAGAATSTAASGTGVDESQPNLTIRIQLPDGTRLPARFNASMTVGDVYQFVERASPATQSRPWVLATTFPNKDHTDKSLVLGDMAEFKKGGTAVVKWV